MLKPIFCLGSLQQPTLIVVGLVALQLALNLTGHFQESLPQYDCYRPSHSSSMTVKRLQYVLFGDSITQQSFEAGGWGARLTAQYARKADVILRGYSGYNIVWASHLLQAVFPSDAPSLPDLVTVFFGANDAALKGGCNDRQHVSLEDYKKRLVATVNHLRDAGVRAVVIITPPPIDESARRRARMQRHGLTADQVTEPDRLNVVTGKYAAIGREIAAELGLPCADAWSEFQQNSNWRALLSDGLHLSPSGNEALYKLLQSTIDTHLPELRYESLPFDFPLHDEISAANPGAAFSESGKTLNQPRNGKTRLS